MSNSNSTEEFEKNPVDQIRKILEIKIKTGLKIEDLDKDQILTGQELKTLIGSLTSEQKTNVLLDMLSIHSPETAKHCERVTDLALKIFKRLPDKADLKSETLKTAALIHNVGKIFVPKTLIDEPGRLDIKSMDIMRKHIEYGQKLASFFNIDKEAIRNFVTHHEKYDGSGYPNGLKNNNIPLGGRILAVSDVYDALTDPDRPYPREIPKEKVIEFIESKSGADFDPQIVIIFKELAQGGEIDGKQ